MAVSCDGEVRALKLMLIRLSVIFPFLSFFFFWHSDKIVTSLAVRGAKGCKRFGANGKDKYLGANRHVSVQLNFA